MWVEGIYVAPKVKMCLKCQMMNSQLVAIRATGFFAFAFGTGRARGGQGRGDGMFLHVPAIIHTYSRVKSWKLVRTLDARIPCVN